MLNRYCKQLKGAWQSQDFGPRLLCQNFQFFLAMTT
ncbi:octaprenyl-diphosphate synthase [Rickettsia conorii subsp. heilongjiangensis]|uniref:Octaprenyl-diphosphate synthase n=1 Tax=Rickettsia conorii subsp. heilongjiangensis TaxID=226665 RepID=A0AAD1LT08_RICCR|nr:octaprenyl-diphosphate synthase [Rickettsia conorii subsp. heilongjiangensis]BBM92907.1 octaprenyl-diphosphate synthase [Rickettsia conorii subsp. heilongjiangensis]BBM94116.1 octaprenyl-diphosphate synthase [Rickettsia conorii subsp. heilongjiangensis]BBM95325.1 octaprenyl-diphosphate synthase [Rickettsia conorii subsp. heilongjiangensis]